MLAAALLVLPLAMASKGFNPKCRADACASQVQWEKSASCSGLFPPKTVTPAPTTVKKTITSVLSQTVTSTLVVPSTSTDYVSVTNVATVTDTIYDSITQTVSNTILQTDFKTDIASITQVSTVSTDVTVTSTETDTYTTIITTTSGSGWAPGVSIAPTVFSKREALPSSSQAQATSFENPHFALVPPNALTTGLVERGQPQKIACPDKCANTASFSSACACLGFKASTITLPRSTVTRTSVVTQTTKSTQTVISTSLVPAQDTATVLATATQTLELTSIFTATVPVTEVITNIAEITSTFDATATSTNLITETQTTTTTVTSTSTVVAQPTCSSFKLQLVAPAGPAGDYLTSNYQMSIGSSDPSSAGIFHLDLAQGNKLRSSDGKASDYDPNYSPSPVFFDPDSTIATEPAWINVVCSIDTSAKGPAYPILCYAGDENVLQVSSLATSGDTAYLQDSLVSGYDGASMAAYHAC